MVSSDDYISARDWRRQPPLPLRVTKKLDIHWCWIKCTRRPHMRAVAIAPYIIRWRRTAGGTCCGAPFRLPPAGPDWLHAIKHDGFRLMARRENGRLRLFTRNGHGWAARYPAIVAAATSLQARSFLIDGEVVIADAQGVASFNLLRGRAREARAFVWAFDLLELDGEDLRDLPLERRNVAGDGPALFA